MGHKRTHSEVSDATSTPPARRTRSRCDLRADSNGAN